MTLRARPDVIRPTAARAAARPASLSKARCAPIGPRRCWIRRGLRECPTEPQTARPDGSWPLRAGLPPGCARAARRLPELARARSRAPAGGASPAPSPAAVRRRRLLALRRLAAALLRRAVGPGRRPYGSGNSDVGRIYHNSLLLTTHASRRSRPRRAHSQRRPRAVLAQRLCESPPWSELTQPADARPPVPQPRLGREHRHALRGDGQVDRPEGGRGADVRVAARDVSSSAQRPST
jgi:hypothetical protein